ncbi:Alcohol dehydrogenase GroES-like domain protein [Aspergillus parasiticus SU-1]|uniref:Alcohol dehydrogenase GroES-like domain protein n=1 Tax=Aspergillus parasiticus (strain ATCC 56775 / NRRL 5862 / SRRC 143 / SU-1) TaxID=1403190 RepID=A0A0F0IH59_ASPPU|nr:Alcohol dehydrogenase GroES-like domain protein [Aspergillus parasiticus SU-1]
MSTMKAFQFDDVQSGLQLRTIQRPQPEQGQVIIQVKAAGLCHSDCIILQDDQYNMIMRRPIVLGHEVAGTIIELGPGVSDYQVGDKVVAGIPTHPVAQDSFFKAIGLGYDGGYAEHAMAWAENLVRIPSGVSFAQAAVATDSIATAYHAVIMEGRVGPDSTVAIVGLGGLGLPAIQIAAIHGARVYAVDIDETKFPVAGELGAIGYTNGLDKFDDIAFDTVVDFAGAGITTAAAVNAVKPCGRVVVVGLAAKQMNLDTHAVITRNITLQGSIGSSLEELKEVLRLIADGRLSPILEEISFESIPQGLERLAQGKVTGRLFTNPTA